MTWPTVALGELATFAMGQAPPGTETNVDGVGTPFFRSGEFGELRPQTRIWTTKPLRLASASDVLVCVVGANCGEINLGADGAIGRSVAAVSPSNQVDQLYLFHFLTSFTQRLRRGAQGSAQGVITKRDLAAIRIPLPPLDEQHRIVELLEDHLSRLDAAEQGLRMSLTRIRRLRESALVEAVSTARVHASTTVRTIGDLAVVTTGMTPLKSNNAFYDGGTVPWITSGELSSGVVDVARQFVTARALSETSLKLVGAGAILLAMYGEGKTRGTAALLEIDATTNQACAAIRLHDMPLRPWVKMVLDSNYAAMRRMAAGGVQPNLNLSLVRSIQVPVPDAEVREAAFDRLREIEEQGAILRKSLEATLRRGATLRHALLAAASSGDLSARPRSAA